jgi:hypothetical protein
MNRKIEEKKTGMDKKRVMKTDGSEYDEVKYRAIQKEGNTFTCL